MMRRLLPILALLALAVFTAHAGAVPARSEPAYRVLVFSKTAGFRHASIPDGIAAIRKLGEQNHFAVDATEDAAAFTPQNLARYRLVIFLSTTGNVLALPQQIAFQQYIRGGGGFVGVHAATDTEYDWPWYAGLVGAQFARHPAVQQATIDVEDRTHPSTMMLPERWVRTDEWYDFRLNPRPHVHVLATLDESTYKGGKMGADHPAVWYHNYDGGHAWYTAFGHTRESFSEPLFLAHLLGGIQSVAEASAPKAAHKTPAPQSTRAPKAPAHP